MAVSILLIGWTVMNWLDHEMTLATGRAPRRSAWKRVLWSYRKGGYIRRSRLTGDEQVWCEEGWVKRA
jgi:hypothetical protein